MIHLHKTATLFQVPMYGFWFGLIYGGTTLGAMSLLCNDMLITVLAPDEIRGLWQGRSRFVQARTEKLPNGSRVGAAIPGRCIHPRACFPRGTEPRHVHRPSCLLLDPR